MGPFEAEQLLLRPGFGPDRLVCPEEHSEEESYWKEAFHYPELTIPAAAVAASFVEKEQSLVSPALPPQASAEETRATTEEYPLLGEIDSAVDEFSSLSVSSNEPALFSTSQDSMLREEELAQRDVALASVSVAENTSAVQTPSIPNEERIQTAPEAPSKISPIEEYFNTIKSGDLGNILGIPDPKENSDLNLARVIESQFEKTDPQISKAALDSSAEPQPDLPHEAQETASSLEAESLLAANVAPLSAEEKQETAKQSVVAGQEEKEPEQVAAKEEPEQNGVATEEQQAQTATAERQLEADPVISTILEGKLEKTTEEPEIAEPVHSVSRAIPLAASVEDKELDNLSARLPAVPKRYGWLKWLVLLMGTTVLAFAFWLNLRQEEKTQTGSFSPKVKTENPASEQAKPAGTAAMPAVASLAASVSVPQPTDFVSLAKQTVQQYQLSGGRGTVREYLSARYASELASGYSAAWSAEPLHKDVYVVKYRLTKTRKEPVVYIFQVNTAKKKLTGALNNITLDLVGKIN